MAGGSGSGAIRRGIGAAFSGMRTLNRNRQLLWFGLLAGLVLAGNAVTEGAFWYINRTLQPDIIGYYIQDFFLSFATLFSLLILLAGLILSLSSKNDHASFFKGLAGAKKIHKTSFPVVDNSGTRSHPALPNLGWSFYLAASC